MEILLFDISKDTRYIFQGYFLERLNKIKPFSISFCLLGISLLDVHHTKINSSISHCLLERYSSYQTIRAKDQNRGKSFLTLRENFCFIALETGSFLTGWIEGLAKGCFVAVEIAMLPALLRLRRPGKTTILRRGQIFTYVYPPLSMPILNGKNNVFPSHLAF